MISYKTGLDLLYSTTIEFFFWIDRYILTLCKFALSFFHIQNTSGDIKSKNIGIGIFNNTNINIIK